MPSIRVVTGTTQEPVSLEDIKLHLRLQSTDTTEDEYLKSLITAARKEAENKTRRVFIPQTFKLFLDDFEDEMILPVSPLSTSTADVSITYLDNSSGDSTSLSSTYFRIDSDSEPGRILLDYGQTWPTVYPVKNAVQIQFVAGYPLTTVAPTTDTCPQSIETWIKMRVAALYENRESLSMSYHPPREMGRFFDGLLDPYVVMEVKP